MYMYPTLTGELAAAQRGDLLRRASRQRFQRSEDRNAGRARNRRRQPQPNWARLTRRPLRAIAR